MNLNAPARLGIFAVALGASLGVGLAVGAAVGPVDDEYPPPAHQVDHGEPSATTTPAPVEVASTPTADAPATGAPMPSSAPASSPSTTSTTVDHSQMGHATTEAQP